MKMKTTTPVPESPVLLTQELMDKQNETGFRYGVSTKNQAADSSPRSLTKKAGYESPHNFHLMFSLTPHPHHPLFAHMSSFSKSEK